MFSVILCHHTVTPLPAHTVDRCAPTGKNTLIPHSHPSMHAKQAHIQGHSTEEIVPAALAATCTGRLS